MNEFVLGLLVFPAELFLKFLALYQTSFTFKWKLITDFCPKNQVTDFKVQYSDFQVVKARIFDQNGEKFAKI